jgi:flagellar M-ring protein FliF
MLVVVAALSCLGVYAAFVAHLRTSAPVELFSHSLTPAQMAECSGSLTALGVEPRPNPDKNNLMVPPNRRLELLRHLSFQGLPHEDPTANSTTPFNSTQRQQLAQQQSLLQSRLATSLRQLQGVVEASVQLALPESELSQANPTASVMLRMQPGVQLDRHQSLAIARFVAGAVPGLKAEEVTVMDDRGALARKPGDSPVESLEFELRQQMDLYLSGKAQRLLDKAYGRGRALVEVSCEFDMSQMEIKKTDVGAPGQGETIVVQQKIDEKYASGDSKDYGKICEATRQKSDEVFSWTVFKSPRISRLTCSVLIDQSTQVEAASRLVRGAIGMMPERGDQLEVSVVPMAQELLPQPEVPPTPQPEASRAMGPLWAVLATGLAGAALALFWLGSRRSQRPRLEGNAPQAGTRPLADLLQGPGGRSLPAAETSTRGLARLEDLARQQPQETAHKLKTYFGSTFIN